MSNIPSKISILLPDLRSGGAERLHVSLAREWIRLGIEVEFVLRMRRGELLDSLPEGITAVGLNASRVRSAFIPLVRYLHRSRPSVLLAAMWPLSVVASLAARAASFEGVVAVSEHSPLSVAYRSRGRGHLYFQKLTTAVGYRLAHARVGVSRGVADDMAWLSGMPKESFSVIYNPAALGIVLPRGQSVLPIRTSGRSLILSVGTLKPVKRHDILIRAFSRLRRQDSYLCILGEGPERERLEKLVSSLGLEDRVLLPGHQRDTVPWYANAELFVLSSDYEGFGNVIVEALEQGTPVICTDCPSGPREILADGRYGTLVPVGDVDALAGAMEAALSQPHDRDALKRRAQDFRVDKAADAYLQLMLSALSEHHA